MTFLQDPGTPEVPPYRPHPLGVPFAVLLIVLALLTIVMGLLSHWGPWATAVHFSLAVCVVAFVGLYWIEFRRLEAWRRQVERVWAGRPR